MPNVKKSKLEANKRYNNKTYETISARAIKTERLNDLLDLGATRAGMSKASYILETLRARLQRDGITRDQLPPLEDPGPILTAAPED